MTQRPERPTHRQTRRDFLRLATGGVLALPAAAWVLWPNAGAAAPKQNKPIPPGQAKKNPPNQAPRESIQALVDAARPGDTVIVPAGIYRETVTINKPLTLIGEPGAEIRGSDVWTNWRKRGRFWVHGGLPTFPRIDAPGRSSSGGRQNWPEQVFFDGQPLLQVASDPVSGQFAVNSKREVILADDPTGHVVEVTTRQYWINPKSDHVTIQGFTMKHAATPPQHGAINNGGYSHWTIRDNILSDAHGAVVSLVNGSGLALINNDISRGGQLGVHGWRANDSLVQGNRIHDNNTEGFSVVWEAGGLKISDSARLAIDVNEAWGNNGPGLWCDLGCDGVTISHNRVHHNTHYGINYEISRNADIFGNEVWENGWEKPEWGWGAGILVQNSADTEVFGNIVAWNADGISIISQNRSDSPPVTGNYVHDNTICIVNTGEPNVLSLAWLEDWNGRLTAPESHNIGLNNRFYHWNPHWAPWPLIWGREAAFPYEDTSGFSRTPGGQNSWNISADEKNAILSAVGIPLEPERR